MDLPGRKNEQQNIKSTGDNVGFCCILNIMRDMKNIKKEEVEEVELVEYKTYLELFKNEFTGIAEHLLDENDKIKRAEVAPDGQHLSDEELLKKIINEILEIPENKERLQ